MKLNTKLLTISALFIAALMLLSPISQTNTSGGGGIENSDLDFLNSLDINNNNFVLSADSLSDSVDVNYVKVVDENGTKELQYNNKKVDSKTTFISVSDVKGLIKLSDLVNDATTPFDFSEYTIKLTKNLTLTDPDPNQSNFTPIGKDDSKQFKGTFDGQGHTISNLSVNINSKSGNVYSGLFGYLGPSATVKNLGIINSEISATSTDDYAYSGGIAGWNEGGTITNCYNTGAVTESLNSGGIAGYNSGTITNCYNTGDVTGSNHSGGIAGWNEGGTITNCYNTGDVTGTTYSGGIAGSNIFNMDNDNYGTITNCYNTGAVTGSLNSGGIAGYNSGGAIENCYNTGAVTATSEFIDAYSGGIAGHNSGTITNCYNTGVVTATSTNDKAYSGGVVGSNSLDGTITNCYNTGAVTGTNTSSGGIAGWNDEGTIINCYNTGAVTGTNTSTGGIAGGNNDKSTIQSCYFKEGSSSKPIGNDIGAVDCKSFNEDGEFSDSSGSLLDALNEWVTKANEQNPDADKYRYWMNEKYPVFTDWYGEAERLNKSLEKNSNGVYEIKNGYQLALIADDLNGNYVLADDINLLGYEWRPIGNSSNKFNGTFDGQGHTISNLSVNINSKSGNVYAGLFGYLDSNTTVKNLGIIDSVIFTNTNYNADDRAFSGGIAGYNTGTVMNCYYTGTVIGSGTVTFGGIVGENSRGTIINCYNTGTVIGTETSGGIAGYNSKTITNCYNTGVVIATTTNGDANSGGIVGNNGGPITNCYNIGKVTATATGGEAFSGGITGNNSGQFDNNGTIENCYNTGDVTGTGNTVWSGGIAGFNSGKITNCYNTGDVTGTATADSTSTNRIAASGGIAGQNTVTITNCYNTGKMTATATNGEAFSGGIAGENHGTIINCYNTGTVIGTETSGGIAGYNSKTITNCYNTGVVIATTTNGDANSGGIVGNNGGPITNCYNIGKVTATATGGEAFSGGITGNNSGQFDNNGTIENCYNTGDVTGTGNTVWSGGIAGFNSGKITNCYNTGDVTGTATADSTSTNRIAASGGIAGQNTVTITNCYNTGKMTATATNGEAFSGGIAGENHGTITNCYNTGKVTATATNVSEYSGGIAGYNYTNGTITNCYYLMGCVLNGTDEGTELTSDAMNGLNLLGVGSNNNLNKDEMDKEITDPKLKPWSPDIFGINDGYPILADVPTQIDPSKSANKPPQSAVYIILNDSKNAPESPQAENYLKPFMLTNGNEVAATINCLNNQTENITSYQWYEMNDEGVFIETNEIPSPSKIIHGTYCVKVTSSDGYSYTSLTRTVLNIITVTFESNGGSDVGKIETYYNETISQPEGPTKTGYEVEGWYCDSSFINEYEFETTPVTTDITLYAKWKLIDYSVKYDGNNNTSGTVPIDETKYTINSDITLNSDGGTLAKSGYIFRGWNYTLNASSALPLKTPLAKDLIEKYISEDNILTLYAVWTPIPEPIYTLCLNSNDSTLQTKRYSGTYGTEITLKSASDFGWNSECKFIEWNSKSDGSGVSYKEGDKFSLGSETWNLYAIWSDSSYHTVSFDSNGGNSIPSQSIQDGYRASVPDAPTKQGHLFKHWSLNEIKYDFNQSVKEDITLKAEYEIIIYKVTFYYNGEVYFSTQADYNTSLGDRMPSLPSDKDSWNTSENGKGNNFTADSLITSDISIYAVSSDSISSILIIGGSAAAILAAIAAWLFMRSRYN